MSSSNSEDNDPVKKPAPFKLELRTHSGFEEERNRDNNTLRTGMIVIVVLAALLVIGVGVSKWFRSSATNSEMPTAMESERLLEHSSSQNTNNLSSPSNSSTELQKQEASSPANEMTEAEGLAEDAGIEAADAEYAAQQNQQTELERIQAEAEAATAKKEALQAEAKKASMLNTCMTESRTLTTEAGNLVRLNDSEAESYCQCISRSDSNDLNIKKKNCLNQLL